MLYHMTQIDDGKFVDLIHQQMTRLDEKAFVFYIYPNDIF